MSTNTLVRQPWNKGKLVGQKAPLKLGDIYAIRVRLQVAGRTRDLAPFQSRHRFQAPRLRPCRSKGPGRHAWRSGAAPGDGIAAKDADSGSV